MTDHTQKLKRPPIVEAVVDIDCDLPPNVTIETLEQPARSHFQKEYPVVQTRQILEHKVEAKGNEPPKTSMRRGVEGYLFKTEDGRQLVQVRTQGFSFNRLAPYSTLDDYLPEIERTWKLFVGFAAPVQIRAIRLRCINRIPLPSIEEKVELRDFLKVEVGFPEESGLQLVRFLNRYAALDPETSNWVEAILTCSQPEGETLPIILDITATNSKRVQPDDWPQILGELQVLRNLKNRVFFNTLKETCLQLFR